MELTVAAGGLGTQEQHGGSVVGDLAFVSSQFMRVADSGAAVRRRTKSVPAEAANSGPAAAMHRRNTIRAPPS